MAWQVVDETYPQGTNLGNVLDSAIRTFKQQVDNNFQQISGYPNNIAQITATWTTATRPTANLVVGLEGFNSTTGAKEYWNGSAWVTQGMVITTTIVQSMIDAIVPIGTIMMWSGSLGTVPTHWHLCDGSSGTIDLRDKFIVGAGNSYTVAATGGEATHTLSQNEMPSHHHTLTPTGAEIGAGWNGQVGIWYPQGTYTGNTMVTDNTGGGAAHNNLPPYFALAYIQRIS